MLQARRQLRTQALMFGHEGFGNVLKGGEVRGGIAVAPRMVGDDSAPFLKEGQQGRKQRVGIHISQGGVRGEGDGGGGERLIKWPQTSGAAGPKPRTED